MSWQARVQSGDASAALVQPHQVVVSREDACLHSIAQLDLVCVQFAAQPAVLLECVIDRQGPTAGGAALAAGRVQLHSWFLETCGQLEGVQATLNVPERPTAAVNAVKWRLTLSLQRKIPLVATSGRGNSEQELGGSRVDLLPESVRQKQIDLEAAIRRQLRAAGTLSAPREGQLVPVRLLGDTYVFRIDGVKEQVEATETSLILVTGWSDETFSTATEELTEKVAALRIQDATDGGKTTGRSYEDELSARLWRIGFAGYTAFVQDVLLNLALVLRRSQKTLDGEMEQEQIGSHGVLISGANGVGKSLALMALQHEMARKKIDTWSVDGMSILMGAGSSSFPTAYEYLAHELERKFSNLGSLNDTEAKTFTSSSSCIGVVLIDDLDVLFQSPDAEGSDTQLPQLGSALLRVIDELSARNARLVIVGTTTNADANMPLAVKRTGRFSKVLDLVVPTEQSRREILRRHLSTLPLYSHEQNSSVNNAARLSSRLAALTGGYVAKDLVRICRNAAAQAHVASISGSVPSKSSVGWEELLHAQQQVKPSQLRELNVASPGASMDGKLAFAGYDAIRKQFFDFISWKFHPTAAINRLGISNASGILLSGPSGCGKTLLVQTLAAQAQVNFVSVKSSELLSKYFGDSEKAVRELFDAALIRPGRIDKTIELGFPTQKDIQDILTLYTRKMPLATDVNIEALAARPRGSRTFTGADIAAICKEAAFRALREDIDTQIVLLRHFEAAWDHRTEGTLVYTPLATAKSDSTSPQP
ncbi:hypothetical protein BBJ29_002879 [Phytophthora kernoviae]|uniref:AAA+ ATPase domain-containing protein n=1 Tax=Phytophthora kernoviae TaxID=325452 RepID=A0A421G4X6_9STRA|nr:hypothetical protein BBJ29_002879 [Phytophthora kernoviae]